MKKMLVALLVAGFTLSTLVGCGGAPSTAPKATTTTAAGKDKDKAPSAPPTTTAPEKKEK